MNSPDGPALSRGYDMTSTGDQESEDSMTLPWDGQELIRSEGSKRNLGQLVDAAGGETRRNDITPSLVQFVDDLLFCFYALAGLMQRVSEVLQTVEPTKRAL